MSTLAATAALPPDEAAATTRRAWFGFIAMMFGNFMAILDIQIVASSLKEIQAGLSASADELAWVQTSYLIAEVIAIPLSGYLSRMLSTRVYFVICAGGFTFASLLCAMAWTIESSLRVVHARLIQAGDNDRAGLRNDTLRTGQPYTARSASDEACRLSCVDGSRIASDELRF